MTEEIKAILEKANCDKHKTKEFLNRLKKRKIKNLDLAFQSLHDEVFEEINCLDCSNCCSSISPIISHRDIERMAKALRISPSQVIEKFLHIDEDNDYVYNDTPCPFLLSDNYCSIYENRPKACREYPHTDRSRIHQLLNLTYKNTLVCPAVYLIVNRLSTQKEFL
ncbi:MAG: YkgJ family cysteine cluster protein [Bacteroidota bacterium]|nr:YkgJ family cysteine cluster protein [Bacteroidota bacterium]